MSFIRNVIDPPGATPEQRTPRDDDGRPTLVQGLLLDTAVGIPVLFALSAAMLGSVSNALGFLAMAVICTAGFSLLLLLPLAWVLGALVRRPLALILNRTRRASSAA